ncbi:MULTISPECIES: acyltransferase [unclassified Endozoicomonas]|uniref:acyltransferase n=1 Tax=unclassified Endozoicomonas TaxID=2644528 RepID=UPI0021494D20|nr:MULTISPECIES: acyltransferase family protein [unclassified Endozoicomonas]
MSSKREPVFYLDLLRVVAAIAVIMIHVLGPYRELYGQIPMSDWLTAVTFNSFSRWCVPIFIMITGMLFLSDKRPFDLNYFLRRRVMKVLVPFLFWAVFYSFLAGLTPTFDYEWTRAINTLKELPYESTWYHLGFYYYFIPLYLVIPFLKPAVQAMPDDLLKFMAGVWLWLTLSYLIRIETFWHINTLLYGGYLIWGYCLAKYDTRRYQSLIIFGGILGLILTLGGVFWLSNEKGTYSSGRFNSYKTINTVLVATMVFCLAKHYCDKFQGRSKSIISILSRYSLGIYLVHPLLLWPVRAYDLYPASAIIMIPFWTVVTMLASTAVVWLLGRSRLTHWIVP